MHHSGPQFIRLAEARRQGLTNRPKPDLTLPVIGSGALNTVPFNIPDGGYEIHVLRRQTFHEYLTARFFGRHLQQLSRGFKDFMAEALDIRIRMSPLLQH